MGFACFKHRPRPVVQPTKPVASKPITDLHLAIVVGHNEKRQGANNYLGESEWVFNKRIAHKLAKRLAEKGLRASIIFRPKSGGYSYECSYVRSRVKELGCNLALLLHFNAAGASARGCEVLIADTPSPMDNSYADKITDLLNEELGIKERHNDGVKVIYSGHNGYGMINGLVSIGVPAALVEPCFGGYRTSESEAIFENEDNYVSILERATEAAAS